MYNNAQRSQMVLFCLLFLGVLCSACGAPINSPVAPPTQVEEPVWRLLSSKESFLRADKRRRLIMKEKITFQKMTKKESRYLPRIFSYEVPTHYAFFINGQSVSTTEKIPSNTFFCGIMSRDLSHYDAYHTKSEELRGAPLTLQKGTKLSVQAVNNLLGFTHDVEKTRSLVYKAYGIESWSGEKIGVNRKYWKGFFLCGVFLDGIVDTERTTGRLSDKLNQWLGLEKDNAEKMLIASGKTVRHEILAKPLISNSSQ